MLRVKYAISALGGYIISLLGGIDDQIIALLVLMALDFISGLMTAAAGKSTKSSSGHITSKAAGAGLLKKGAYLIVVMVAVLLERVSGLSFVREAVIISFAITEAISVLENCSRLGIAVPPAIVNALGVLKKDPAAENKEGPQDGPQDHSC